MIAPHLLLFTRYPEPGHAKTRLIPRLGPHGAANLQRQLTQHVLSQVTTFQRQYAVSTEIYFAGGSLAQMADWLGEEWQYRPQHGQDLGARLMMSLQQTYARDRAGMVIIGCDCPGLGVQQLTHAFQQLKSHEIVLGPALDGGYYLIGLQHPVPELFQNIAWGTDRVLQQTLKIASSLKLSVSCLEWLNDVDRPEDLWVWEQIQAKNAQIKPGDTDPIINRLSLGANLYGHDQISHFKISQRHYHHWTSG